MKETQEWNKEVGQALRQDLKWNRVLALFRKLGAPEPVYTHDVGYANFILVGFNSPQGRYEGDLQIATDHPGVALTDLFRAGVITLSEEAANFGGVPNVPIETLEQMLPRLKGKEKYPEKFK